MEPITIPYSFVRERLELQWPDVAWGFRHGWLSADGVVEYSVARLTGDPGAGSIETGLASLTGSEFGEIATLLDRLVNSVGPGASVDSERKWLFLILAWVYAHRNEYADPLGVVEEIYADFGYPPELRGFVRYMPPDDHYEPAAHTHAENVARLFGKWAEYLASFRDCSFTPTVPPKGQASNK